MSTSAAHCWHQSRADVPRRMTKSRLVSIVMRTVFVFSKRVSNRSSGTYFCGTFRFTFWLAFWAPPQRERILLEERLECPQGPLKKFLIGPGVTYG
jgi:hypothetical protein